MRADCPPKGMLHQYSLGDLTDTEAEMIASHLEECQGCLESLNEISKQPDSLLSALKKGTNSNHSALTGNIQIQIMDLPPGTELNGYRIEEEIGHGGMGRVYRAGHPRLDQQVALKVIKPGHHSPQLSIRFEAEQQALALMNHPNIARVLDGGMTKDGRAYLVMEMIQGVAINKYCDQHRLDLQHRLELFIQVCNAVQHAHQKGIIHRDIKPSNVLITEIDGEPVPKIIDFGVAKVTHDQSKSETRAGMVIGTPEYMSPEQASLSSLDIDTRSDVYALGVLLYELLTGVTPFRDRVDSNTPVLEIFRAIREDDPPAPSSRLSSVETVAEIAAHRSTEPGRLVKHIQGELDWIILKCLEKEPAKRYSTATALAEDIQHFLCNEPVSASPPSLAYRARKFVRRNRAAVLAGFITLMAMAVGIVLSSIGFLQANVAKVAAEKDRDEKKELLKKLEEEKANTEKALKLEQETRKHAITALRSLTDRFVTRQLGQQAALTENDREYYKKIITIYEAYSKIREDGIDGQTLLAEGYLQIGRIRQILGEKHEAIESFQQSTSILLPITSNKPGPVLSRTILLRSYLHHGIGLRAMGKLSEAEELFQKSLDMAKEIMREEPGDRIRKELQHVMSEMAKVHYDLGNHIKSESLFQDAIKLCEEAKEGGPHYVVFQSSLANLRNDYGMLLEAMKKSIEAEANYQQAIDIYLRIMKSRPNDPNLAFALSKSYGNLSALYNNVPSKQERSRIASLECIKIVQKLVSTYPVISLYRADLSLAYNNLGVLLTNQKKYEEAKKELEKALELITRLIEENPKTVEYQIQLGANLCNLGKVYEETNRPDQAIPYFEKAIDVLIPLATQKKAIQRAANYLKNCYQGRGNAYMRLKQFDKSIEDWDRAIAMDPMQEFYKVRKAQCLATVDPEAAMIEAERISNAPGFNSNYAVAGIYSVASQNLVDQAQREASQAKAVEFLRKLQAKNYFADRSRVQKLKNEQQFIPIREREDFKLLIEELEK